MTTHQRLLRDGSGLPPGSADVVHEIDDLEVNEFAEVAARFGTQRFGYVVTPNVDHMVRYHEDPEFRSAYGAAEYVLLDSRFASHLLRVFRGVRLPVCTGADLTAALLDRVIQPTDQIVLIGGTAAQSEKLRATFGLTKLTQHVPPMGFISDPVAVEACLQFVEAQSPFRFCFLAVGSPQQELIAERLKRRGTARGLALCVGASLNFLTATENRAPLWMQRAGLEWLFRLLQNPKRLGRRYLLRGPRFFLYLQRIRIVLRTPTISAAMVPAVTAVAAEAIAEATSATAKAANLDIPQSERRFKR